MISKFFEYNNIDKYSPIKSFYLKDKLNPKIWDNFQFKDNEIKSDLLKLAQDYIDSLELGNIDISDIVLTGSNCNFNWSEYSDWDIHIILDFKLINDDIDLVKKYLDSFEKLWKEHHDIQILGYDIEIYCQDINDTHTSTGLYSLLNDKWIKKPSRENFTPDEDLIKKKSSTLMDEIDESEKDFEKGIDYYELKDKTKRIWKKIKGARKSGLEKDGEYCIENLVFKLLRRNGYIGKLLELRRKAYDSQFK